MARCSTKDAASSLAHHRWGTSSKTGPKSKGKSSNSAPKMKKAKAPKKPEVSKEEHAAAAKKIKEGKFSTHFQDKIDQMAARHGIKKDDFGGKKKKKKKVEKAKSASPKINNLQSLVRRK